eukprot:scaffold3374_cov115-Skeletonema_dohrnii-CCMP3373.AAC.1
MRRSTTSSTPPEASALSYYGHDTEESNHHSPLQSSSSSSCDIATMTPLIPATEATAHASSARPNDATTPHNYNHLIDSNNYAASSSAPLRSSRRNTEQDYNHHLLRNDDDDDDSCNELLGEDSSSSVCTTIMAAVENYSQHHCSSSRTTATKIFVLSLLLFVAAVAIVYNNQDVYDDKWSIDNNVMSDTTTATSLDNDATSSGRRRDSIGSTTSSSTSTSSSSTTLLTRTSQLSSLLSNLDASDVIECYIVTRMANLANVETYSSSSSSLSSGKGSGGSNNNNNDNNNNRRNIQTIEKDNDNDDNATASTSSSSSSSSIPTGPILIRKAALAFRYRPKVASVSHVTPGATATTTTTTTTSSSNNDLSDTTTTTLPSAGQMMDQQKYFELTLEYGPQRAGASKTSESMPMVHVDMEVMANYNNEGGNNNNNSNDNNIGKYVSWDNQGSIYYSTHISNEWSGAYYMAPITGVVFEKILEKVIEYPTKRPRYQPFEVVSIPSNNIILRSSGSDDFVWDMFRDLADLYVDIDPILVPQRGKVQFYVADPIIEANEEEDKEDSSGGGGRTRSEEELKRQRRPNPNVKRVEGALESSKAAAFYENFFNCAHAKKTGDYSMYLPLVTSAPSPVPPLDEEDTVISNTTLDVSKADKVDDGSDGDGSLRRLDGASNSTSASTSQSDFNVDAEVEVKGGDNSTESSPPTESEEVGDDAETAGVAAEGDEDNSISSPLIDADDDDDDEIETTEPDEANVDSEDDGDAAKAAEKAAIEAAQKAEAAAAVAATNSSSPEDSAKAASEAAIAAKKAADASVASRAKSSAEGLLSGDGATMTSILSSCFSDPKYGIRNVYEEQSTPVTTTYAYVYLDGDVFIRLNLTAPYWGPSTVLQTVPPPHAHVEGQGDVVDWAIFLLLMGGTVFGFLVMVHQLGVSIDNRLQFRHVFHPLADDDSVEMERLEKGGGIPHSIGIDAIPVSLGGQLSHYNGTQRDGPPSSYKDRLPDSSIDDENNGLLDIELANRENIVSVNSPKGTTPKRIDLPISLRLKEEAPDLVERPTLKSMSKVALPHSSPREEQKRVLPDTKKTNLPVLPNMT